MGLQSIAPAGKMQIALQTKRQEIVFLGLEGGLIFNVHNESSRRLSLE